MAKKKKDEITKKAWTASDYLENRKRRVEGATSYTPSKGETSSQINARNIVRNAGEGFTGSNRTAVNTSAVGTSVQNDAVDELKRRQQNVNHWNYLGQTGKRPFDYFSDYLIPMTAKADQQKEHSPLLKNSGVKVQNKVGNVDINNRPIVRNDDGTISTTSTAYQERWKGDEENGHYEIGHFATIKNDGTRLSDDVLDEYIDYVMSSDDPYKADSEKYNLLYGIFDKLNNGETINDSNIEQAMKEAEEWDVNMHDTQDKMYSDKIVSDKAMEQIRNYTDKGQKLNNLTAEDWYKVDKDLGIKNALSKVWDKNSPEAVTTQLLRPFLKDTNYRGNPYERQEFQPTENAADRLKYASLARQDENNPLNKALEEAKKYNYGDNTVIPEALRLYTSMTPMERQRYNEIYGEYGRERAEEFKNSLTDSLNSRMAKENYSSNSLLQNPLGRVAGQFGSGVRNFAEGINNTVPWALGSTQKKANTVNEYESMMMREGSSGEIENVAQDLAKTAGMMAPTAAIGNLASSATLGSALFGLSVGGNSYQEAINKGNSVSAASVFATQQALDETVTNYLLDGVAGMSSGALRKLLGNTKIANAAYEGLMKFAKTPMSKAVLDRVIDLGLDMGGEFTQEFVQNYTEKITRNLVLGEDNEITLSDPDAWYSAALGALNALTLNAATSPIRTYANNMQLKDIEGTYDDSVSMYRDIRDNAEPGMLKDLAGQFADKLEKGEKLNPFERNVFAQEMDSYLEEHENLGETVVEPDHDTVALPGTVEVNATVQSEKTEIVNAAVDELQRQQQEEIPDTSESTPEEAKIQTETLVNAIQEEDTPEIEFNSKKLDKNSIDNVSQETEFKDELQKPKAEISEAKNDVLASEIAENLRNNTQNGENRTETGNRFTGPVTSDAINAAMDEYLRANNIVEDQDLKSIKDALRPVYGVSGQSVYNNLVRANENFGDDTKTFNRLYNAGRYGFNYSEAGDTSRFGTVSEAAYRSGVNDRDAEFKALKESSDQFIKNPTGVKRGVYINATRGENKAVDKAFKNFTKFVPFSIVVVDSRDKMSLASALSQLKKNGLESMNATVESVFNYKASGTSDAKRGFVVIDINTDNILNTVGHELTHIAKIYNPKGYKIYSDAVLRKLSNTPGYNLENKIAYMQDEYRKTFKQELSREQAEEELVAEAADFLNDKEIIREVIEKDRSFAEKIRDWIRSAADMLKKLMDTSTSREEARVLRSNYETYRDAAKLWTEMLEGAADNYNKALEASEALKANSEVESMIRNQLDLSEGMGHKVIVPGNPMSVEEIFSNDEAMWDKADEYNNATEKAWKNIIEAEDFASLGFPQDKNRYYTLTPSSRTENAYQLTYFDEKGAIGHSEYKTDDLKRLYSDLLGYTPGEGLEVTVVDTKDMIESLPEQTKFQIEKPIEKTKDLVAVHNLSTDNLLKSLEMGGFPSPSIAIIKDSMLHDKYGDCSVYFYRDTIDPKANRKNKAYGGDAWTPTFPRISYKVSETNLKKFNDKIEKLAGINIDSFGYAALDSDNVSSALSGNGDFSASSISDRPIVKLAYLKDKGADVDIIHKDKQAYKELGNTELAEANKYFTEEELKKYASDSDYVRDNPEEVNKARKKINKAFAEVHKEEIERALKKYEETGKGFLKKNADSYRNHFNELTFRYYDLTDFANALLNYRENGFDQEIDTYETKENINKLMKGRDSDYKAWLNSMSEGIIEKSGIRNSKDMYTNSGNRRSWDVLHDDVTLDNLVKAMNSEDAKGKGFLGANIMALATKDFKSVDEMHAAEGQLQQLSDEEYQKLKDQYFERYSEITHEISPKNNSSRAYVDITGILADTLRTKKTVKAIDTELRKYLNIQNDTAQKLVDLMSDLAEMPYGYFEAKPQRAVYLDEIAGVVLPDTASQQLIDALNQKGIDYKQYEAGNDTDRTTKLNDYLEEKPEIRFQIGSYSVNGIDYKVSRDGEDAISENGSVVPILTSKILAKSEMNTGNINDIEDKIELILRELNGKEVVIKSSGERVVFDFDFADEYVRSKSSVGLRKTNTRRAKFNAVSKIKEIIINADNQRYEENIKGDKKSNADRGLYKYDVSFWTVTDNGYDSYTGELVVRLDRDGTDYAYDIVKIKKTAVARIENEGSRGVGPQSVTNKISQSKKKNKKIDRFNKRFRYQLDTSGRNLSSEQAEFFADSKVRDEDGRLMVMYHGTPNGSFNVFRNGINFFTPNKEYASWYKSPSQSSRTAGKTAEAPRTYEVYLNMTHPFDIRNAEDRKAFIDDYVKGGWALGIDPYVSYKDSTKTGLPSWEEADNIYEWMEENDLLDEYDGILVDEGSTESGFDRGISYVTFNPNQIKNVDNENPTDSDDIRYQLNIPSDMFYDPDAEDERLKTANAYLTNMLQASKNLKPSEKDIKKVVKDITDVYNSGMDRKELTRQLTELYTYMRTNEHVDGAQVSETINAIARQVIREAKYADPQQQEMYTKFRKALKDTTVYVDKSYVNDIEPEGWNTLRKKYFGRVKLTANPEMSSHDGIRTYLQLQQEFPEIYRTSVDDIMTDADAVREILYGFETARPKERSLFGEASTETEAAEELATRIMDAYFEVGNESVKNEYLKTYKQVREDIKDEIIREYNNSLKSIQINDAKKLSTLVKNYKAGEITANSLFVTKEALTDYTRQQNEAARELYINKRDKYVDRIQRNKYKDDIIKTSKELAKMILSPTDKKHIPTDMVGPISNVLQYIDFSSNRVNPDGSLPKRTVEADEFHKSITGIIGILNKLDKNNSVYENNGETSYLVIDPDLMQNLREVSEAFTGNDEVKDNVDNLSTQNLRTVAQTLKALKQMVNNANKFINAGRYETVSELAKQSIDDFNLYANRRSASKLATKAKEIAQNKYIGMLDDLLNSGMLDAYTFFDSWGDTGHVLYDNVRAGLDRKIRNTRTAVDFMEESMKRNNVSVKERNRWDNDLIEVELNAQDEPREIKVNMTAAQIMSLYLLNKRGQARMHLYGDHMSHNKQNGGFILEASGKNKPKIDTTHVFKVTEQDVDNLISKLTPKQKAVADDIGRFLTEVTSKWGNEVTQRLYGYNKFEAKNYFPIKVDNTTIGKTSQSLEKGMTMLKNMGQTKSVQQRAYNPLTLQNIFDVYAAQADDMGSYNAFVTSSADLQMWLNYKGDEGNVQRALKNAYGDKANEYFMNILRDINGSRGDPSKWDKALGSLVHLQRGGAIWGNLRVAVQQPFAYIRAADTMKIKYLLQGLTLSPMREVKEWELAKKYAPIAQWKDYGFFDIEVGPSMKRLILGNDTLKDKVADAGMWAASKGDMIAWVRLWYASQAEVKDTHPELKPGTEEFYEEAGKVFSHVIDTTQVVDSVLHRTDIMKDKSTSVKNAAAFLSEPSKTYNMLYRALRDFALSNNKAAAGKRLASTITVWLVAQAVNSAVASFISAMRHHDKDKDLLEKYKEKFVADYLDSLQLWGSIPIIKQWFSAFSGEDQDTDATYSLLSLIPDMYFELMKAKDGKQKKGWWALLYQASQLTSFWGGNNLQNPLRDIDGIIDNLIIRDDMGMYYPYQQAKYDMYAQQDNGSYPNLSRFVSTAMKAYAHGDSELGDKIIADLKAEIPEDKVVNQITSRLAKEPELEELAQATLDGETATAETLTASLRSKGYPEELIEKKVGTLVKGMKPSGDSMARAFVEKSDGWQEQLRKYENYYTQQIRSDPKKSEDEKTNEKIEAQVRSTLKKNVTDAYVDEYRSLDGKGQMDLQKKLLSLQYKGQPLYKEGDFTKKNSTWKK